MLYPWLEPDWKAVAARADRLPHALLLLGPSGIGKLRFGEVLAQRLLCERASGAGLPCGVCPACTWFVAGNHPDFRRVAPGSDEEAADEGGESVAEGVQKKASRQIVVAQIRALNALAAVGAHRGGRRVILLHPAEAMNTATANALLKLLEEPPSSTQFLLVSSHPSRLLATIRSRCQVLRLERPDAQSSAAWLREQGVEAPAALLAFASGSPLDAHRGAAKETQARRAAFLDALGRGGAADTLRLAADCEAWIKKGDSDDERFGLATLIGWMQKWLYDLLLCAHHRDPAYCVDRAEALRRVAAACAVGELFDCYNYLLRLKPVAEHPLNARLFIEDMLIRYARSVAGRGGR